MWLKLIEYASSDKKNTVYFRHIKSKVKGDVQGVDTVCWDYLYDYTFGRQTLQIASLESLQERIWESLTFQCIHTSASDLPVCSRCTSIQNQMVYLS